MLLTPLPQSQTDTPSRTTSPFERDVRYGRPPKTGRFLLLWRRAGLSTVDTNYNINIY